MTFRSFYIMRVQSNSKVLAAVCLRKVSISALTSISFGTYYDDHIDCVRIFIIINIPQTQISSSENIIMCYLFTESNYVDFHRI